MPNSIAPCPVARNKRHRWPSRSLAAVCLCCGVTRSTLAKLYQPSNFGRNNKFCECGRPAVVIRSSAKICQWCADIEERMHESSAEREIPKGIGGAVDVYRVL